MDAQIYSLDDMRSSRNTPLTTERYFPTQWVSDGLALSLSATSFWVEYAVAMASFHHLLAQAPCLPVSK